MKVDAFLSRLDKVRSTGKASWLACCPAHDDRSPSLTISEADDGRVLAHCFAGCPVENVVSAVGMSLADLMPDSPVSHAAIPKKLRVPPMDVLKALAFHATVVSLAACDMGNGIQLSPADKNKLLAISGEIQDAIQYCSGRAS